MIAVVVPCLGIPGLWIQGRTADAVIRSTEKREAAAFPKLVCRQRGPFLIPRKNSLRGYPSKYEAWFNDHLGFRRRLIQLSSLIKMYGLIPSDAMLPSLGENQRSTVLVGRDGWLYLAGDNALTSYRCELPFSEHELDEWQSILETRSRVLADRGIHFLLVIVPNKHTIYPEFLPRSVRRVGSRSRLDQLRERLVRSSAVNILDLREALLAAKSERRVYHQTDTHWNDFGAFVAYREILQRLKPVIDQVATNSADVLTMPGMNAFQIEVRDQPGLDLAVMLDSPIPFREQRIDLRPRRPRQSKSRKVDSESPGHELRVAESSAAPPIRAVVMRDSFMSALAPFLNEHFERVDYVWTYDLPFDTIEDRQPQVVIMEMAERYLHAYQPKNPHEMTSMTKLAIEPTENPR